MNFDPLTTTATALQQLLKEGAITSVQAIERYLLQIEQHNHALNAFISLAPQQKLLGRAAALDEERQAGRSRGPFHGIPIDCFLTSHELGMPTTAGSWAFLEARATNSSGIVRKLMDAGMIILGKTNMTEFCGMKMMNSPGRSAVAGQTLSPYVGAIEDEDSILGHSSPGGSSTGSAVAVAAGFSPLAIGTETIGSIMTPSSRAALYAIKPTTGRQDTSGMYRMTEFFDSYGPMAKSPADVASLLEIMLGRSFQTHTPASKWEDLAVGFVNPNVWKLSPEMCKQKQGTLEQMVDDYAAMIFTLKNDGCAVTYPIELQECSVLAIDGQDAITPIAYWEFKHIGLPKFVEAFDKCPVTSLEDLIRFNKDHAEQAMPPREFCPLKHILDEIYEKEKINLIAAPVDSPFCIYAAAAGYPLGHVPLGQLRYNGRPFGLCLMARADGEEMLLRFMSSYEASVPPRPVPKLSR
ncbi:amidase [Apiospora rasikravindrae]|uniref:Amidase n=1 Tax=Apiospora rasikravindrae TaxID=990691 RepID=A0ABR1U7X0_9PEZI